MKRILFIVGLALLTVGASLPPSQLAVFFQEPNVAGAPAGVTVTIITAAQDAATSSAMNANTTETAPVGSLVVVVLSASTGNTKTVTDSAGNTYTLNQSVTNAAGKTLLIYSTPVSNELASGGTVTVTPTGFTGLHWRAYKISSGESGGGHMDVTARSVNGFGTSHPTGTTGAVAEANEIAISAWAAATGTTYALATSTNLVSEASANVASQYVVGYFPINTGTASDVLTTGAAGSSGGLIAVYKTE